MSKVIYLAGPLTDENKDVQEQNIKSACFAAAILRSRGDVVISPHEMGYHHPDALDYDGWIQHGLRLLDRCDELMLLPKCGGSKGTYLEIQWAELNGKPISFFGVEDNDS